MAFPRIAVLCTGAQGASIGADLALARLDVTFIEQWPEHVVAMREAGIQVNLPKRKLHTPIRALHLCQVAELRERFDVVLLAVKAYDTTWACHLIKPYLADDGVIVGLQNGMTTDAVASVVGSERTIGAVIEIASNMFVPGVTNRQNDHDTSWFAVGALASTAQSKAELAAQLLRHSGRVELTKDIHSSKWMKLVVNAAELVPSAILDLPLAEAVRTPGMLAFMRQAGYEAVHAATADGSRIVPIFGMENVDPARPEKVVDDLLDAVLHTFTTQETLTTTLQDWRKGRKGEGDDINGRVVQTLKMHGRPAPVNERVVSVARQIEAGDIKAQPSNVGLLLRP